MKATRMPRLAQEYLVDPELIVPAREFETDLDFWQRMILVPDFSPFIALGPQTRSLFDEFIESRLDEITPMICSFLANPDIWTLYAQICQLPDSKISTSKTWYDLDEKRYTPKYGACNNRSVLESDLNSIETPCILTDKEVWADSAQSIIAIDIRAKKHDCARAIINRSPSYSIIEELASDAFPQIEFSKETWGTTRKLVGDEHENASIMLRYFSVLNDSALFIWHTNAENHKRITEMRCLGVDCSPENGETDNNNKRIAERTFLCSNKPVYMDWHAKLFRNRNRIYFKVICEENRVLVGGLTKHFDTR